MNKGLYGISKNRTYEPPLSASYAATSSYPIRVSGYILTSADVSTTSLFLGENAGYQTIVNNSNFIGTSAGFQATNANNSNFIGEIAGFLATNANYSNFLGAAAGFQATDANNSNFIGSSAGQSATNATVSNFIGYRAGFEATDAYNSNFLGSSAGNAATNANNSNFIGAIAGANAASANYSNFLGYAAGYIATNAYYSNFIGISAGYQATSANNSNFLGFSAGNSATDANNSNFLGTNAGVEATNAYNSNFLGTDAGNGATNAHNSNFLGTSAGYQATNANISNFIGIATGIGATNADNSNFLGHNAGFAAVNASNSNFLGVNAGFQATSASFSTLIGYQVGYNVAGGALGIKSNNIIIGTNITLPDNAINAINLGGILFGTGSYSTTSGNPFSGSANGRIGINVVNPTYSFEVSGTVAFRDLTNSSTATKVVLIDNNGQLYTTASSGIGGGGIPGGPNTSIQFNNNGTFSGSSNFTFVSASNIVSLTGSMGFTPTSDPDPTGANVSASYLFMSSSNTALGNDLYFRQDGNLVKWKWIEGALSTGLLYGGVLSYNNSSSINIAVSSGSGIIVTPNANVYSEVNPQIKYVTWGNLSASIATGSAQATYVYIDQYGSLQTQNDFFTPEQYASNIPLGMFNHTGRNLITSITGDVYTTYNTTNQSFDFIQAFGPLKISGTTISGQTGTLRLNVSSGESYILGGFYQQDPNNISHKQTSAYLTASIARVYRSGSTFVTDNNNGSFYTTIDPSNWDNGTGTLTAVGGGSYSIQRVFFNPATGRCHVYYGQNKYNTLAEATTNISTEAFSEAIYSSHQYVLAAYLVLKGNTIDLNNTENTVVQAGLFRNTVGSAGGTVIPAKLTDLGDVSISTPTQGQALIYNAGTTKWVNGTPATASYVTGSVFTSTNLALSSSYALSASSAQTASFAATSSNIIGGTLNYVPIWSTATSLANSVIYQSAGNVGIGTTTPSQLLEVSNGDALIRTAYIGNIPAFGTNYTSFSHVSRTGSGDYSFLSDNAGITYINSKIGQPIYFRNNNDSTVIITSAGDVGIGTTSPNAKLNVNGNTTITGSLNVTAGIVGSLQGTASWANNVLSTGIVGNLTQIATGSVTASVTPSQFSIVSGSSTEFVVTGTGVTMGSAITDIHRITGSVILTGSLTVTGSTAIQDPSSQSPFQISSGSTSLFFVSRSGNIGINQATPNAKLHIADSGSFYGIHLENLTTASSGVPQNTPGIKLTGYSYQSPSSSINQWLIYGTGTSGASNTHTLNFGSVTAGLSQTPLQLSQNGSLTVTNLMTAFFFASTNGVLNLGSSNVSVYSATSRASNSTGRSLFLRTNLNTVADDALYINNATNLNISTGTQNAVTVNDTIAYTTGTGSYNAINIPTTISSSAAASGSIVRGLYINPTFTTTVGDYRSIETTAGRVVLASSAFTSSVSQSILSYFTITGSMQQVATTSSQMYAANIVPSITYTAPSQTNTAFRVSPTFSGSTALTASQQNIIADFGATSVGSQFVVNDITSGSIYQVNDVSGLPIIEATSNWDVNIYDYPGIVFKKTGSAIIISGSLNVTGSINMSTGSVTITSGSIIMPNRPAFRVIGASSTDRTGTILSGSAVTVDYNQGNYYNNTTGLFTAPVAGLYSVYFNGRVGSVNSQMQVIIYKNTSVVQLMWEAPGIAASTHFGVSGILSLAANDTLNARVTVGTIQFDGNDSWGATYIG